MSHNTFEEVCAFVKQVFQYYNEKEAVKFLDCISSDFSVFGLAGGPLSEGKSTVEEMEARYVAGLSPDLHPDDIKVAVFGNAAVVTCCLHGSVRRSDGDVWQGPYRYSAMLARDDGRWRIVHDHGSPLSSD